MVYNEEVEDHIEHVKQVLERLRQFSLYIKLSKCLFNTTKVDFLSYVVGVVGILMDLRRIATIRDWPTPTTYREIQIFIRFSNFYRRFIIWYSVVMAPITDLLKGMKKGKKHGSFIWTMKADHTFRMIKECFQYTPLLQHFNPKKPIQLEYDAYIIGLSGIMS
jgi:hypothetical protein